MHIMLESPEQRRHACFGSILQQSGGTEESVHHAVFLCGKQTARDETATLALIAAVVCKMTGEEGPVDEEQELTVMHLGQCLVWRSYWLKRASLLESCGICANDAPPSQGCPPYLSTHLQKAPIPAIRSSPCQGGPVCKAPV